MYNVLRISKSTGKQAHIKCCLLIISSEINVITPRKITFLSSNLGLEFRSSNDNPLVYSDWVEIRLDIYLHDITLFITKPFNLISRFVTAAIKINSSHPPFKGMLDVQIKNFLLSFKRSIKYQ